MTGLPLKEILLAGALQGVILAVLLLTRRVNQPANRIFGVLLLLLTVHLVLVANDNRVFMIRFPHLSHITWVLPALYGPLVLLFLRRLTHLAPRFEWPELLYFLPFTVWLAVQLPYFLQSAAEKRAYLDDYAASVRDDFGWLNQGMNFIHLFFFGWALLTFRRYERRLPHFYSNLSPVRLRWLRDFLYASFGVIVLSVFVFNARKFGWPYLSALYPWHFLGVVVIIYWTAYRAMAQPALFGHEPTPALSHRQEAAEAGPAVTVAPLPPETEAARAEARQTPEQQAELATRLRDAMEKDRLYLKPELTLQELAGHLDSNRQYVSETLNSHVGQSFYDFVNDYRVGAFQRLAEDPSHAHYTILALAYEAGFNSKATFNAIFKKKTGLTPSGYVRQVRTGERVSG